MRCSIWSVLLFFFIYPCQVNPFSTWLHLYKLLQIQNVKQSCENGTQLLYMKICGSTYVRIFFIIFIIFSLLSIHIFSQTLAYMLLSLQFIKLLAQHPRDLLVVASQEYAEVKILLSIPSMIVNMIKVWLESQNLEEVIMVLPGKN